ncbi:MAG: lactonase family protein, partial [Anaerolineae bacterium]|nr:lactonase family protein [Anaerolineae bacterium]
SWGHAPCYVSSDADGRHVLVANYGTGTGVCAAAVGGRPSGPRQ